MIARRIAAAGAAVAALVTSGPAVAQAWTETDQTLAATIIVTRAIDYGQTRWIMSDRGRAAGYRELNPLVRHPWQTLLGGALVLGLAHAYPAHRTQILGAAAVVSVLIVGRNAAIGVRIDF